MRDSLTGLEYMRLVASGEVETGPFTRLLGMRITEVDEGRVVFAAEVRPEHENSIGIAHGGFAATLLDSAMGCAVNSVMPAGKIFTTLEMKINFTRAVTLQSGLLTCTATVLHAGHKTATSEGRILDARGKLCAHGTATFILFRDLTEERKTHE